MGTLCRTSIGFGAPSTLTRVGSRTMCSNQYMKFLTMSVLCSFMIQKKGVQMELLRLSEQQGIRWFTSGHADAESATITLEIDDQHALKLVLEPLYPFFMTGVGYNHPVWGHGMAHDGESSVHYDQLDIELVDRMDPLHWHIQEISRVRAFKITRWCRLRAFILWCRCHGAANRR